MVEKVTIFETHFEGAQFGPRSGPTDEEIDETADEAPAGSGGPGETDLSAEPGGSGRSRWLLGAGLLALAVAVGVLRARRGSRASSGEPTEDVEPEAGGGRRITPW